MKHIFYLLIILTALSHRQTSATEVVLIANPSVAQTSITLSTARSIFSVNTTYWSNKSGVTVFVFPDAHPLHRAFTRNSLHMLPFRLRRAWDKKTFTGTGHAPTTVQNIAQMIHKVATTPGAIGYLPKENVDDSINIIKLR